MCSLFLNHQNNSFDSKKYQGFAVKVMCGWKVSSEISGCAEKKVMVLEIRVNDLRGDIERLYYQG